MVKEQFAMSIMENRTRDFWSAINRMKNSKAGVCDIGPSGRCGQFQRFSEFICRQV